ncbi:MAG: DJ-1/PfpI family protein [Undibacterium sp.]|nr:DJ-1/PfpI family protein [Opitutaceae bacterium]
MKLTRRIVILAYEDMNLLDLAGPLQAFATAGRSAAANGSGLYEVIVASAGGGLVTSSSGLAVMTVPLSKLKGTTIDTILTAGGCRGQSYYAPPKLVKWIKQRAPTVRRVCSVCTGAFLLAAAGQLDGRRVATHWDWVARLRTLHPKIHVDADKLFIHDGPIWTSAGVTAGIDLTLALIEEDFGHRVAIETARQLVMFIKRSGGQSQFSVPLAAQSGDSGTFADLHAWIAGNLASDLRVERLAEQAGMPPRTFARVYAAKSGRTPAKTVEAMRLEAACRALEETSLPLKAIVATTGYAEEQNLRRVFLRKFGVTPSQYRGRFSPHVAPARIKPAPLTRKKRPSAR